MIVSKKTIFVTWVLFVFVIPVLAQDIYEAAWSGNLDRVKALIKENPDLLHIKSEEGYNPLHSATTYNQKEVVKFLIDAGADKNVANLWGKTPFHRAAERGYLEIVEILLEAGADINIKDKRGWTPLRWAISNGQKEVTELLLRRGAELNFIQSDYDRLLHEAADSGYEKLVKLILDKEPDVYSLNNRGGTLLHSAAFGDLKNLAELMVKKEFNIEAKNYYGMTPLHIAAYKGNKDVVEFLIEKNAEVNATDLGRRTPLQHAENEGHKTIVNFLVLKGAETTPRRTSLLKGKYFGLEKPGFVPEIFGPGIISTIDGFEFAGTFSPDGEEFFFTYRKPGVQGNCIKYTKQENTIWCSPVFAPFSSTYREVEPHISPDGKKLYFNSRRPLPGEIAQNNNRDVWVVKKNKEEWGEPQFLGSPVSEEIAMYVTETNDGTIYFTGNRHRGIYKSSFNNNNFSTPERLPDEINYLFNAGHPYIAPDESYIIFDGRDERKNSDDTDLFISFSKSDGSWTRAINMGYPINSDAGEICASVSPDGKYLFFQSSRTGNMDIYWVDTKIIDKLKKEIKF